MSELHSQPTPGKAQKSDQGQQGPLAYPESDHDGERERSELPRNLRPELPRKQQAASNPIKKVIRGPPKALILPKFCQLPDISTALILRQECPWDTYWPIMTCDIAGPVIIATRRSRPSRLQAIRRCPAGDTERLITQFKYLLHPNILAIRECYLNSSSIYALVDDFPLTLGHLVVSTIFPSELELGAILAQILAGFNFLGNAGLVHQSLSCHKILLGLDGIIKIVCLETCTESALRESHAQYIAAIPTITMSLMQKGAKGLGIAGVHDVSRWPVDSYAVSFLSAALVAGSIFTSQRHPLVISRRQPSSELVRLARILLVTAQVDFTAEISR